MANPVILDASAAARIAATIQRVEIGDRSERPLTFSKVDTPGRKTFRIATFTGAWSIGATKTVTFKYQTSTPNTASVLNLFANIPTFSGGRDCAIAREGTAWFLIAARCP